MKPSRVCVYVCLVGNGYGEYGDGVWTGGATVPGNFPVQGRPIDFDSSMAKAYCACSRFRWGLFVQFSLDHHFSLLLHISGRRRDIALYTVSKNR